MQNQQKWKMLSKKYIVKHPQFTAEMHTVKLPTGKIINDYIYFSAHGGAMILPITKSNKIVLLKHYKYAVNEEVFVLPGGIANTKKESPLEIAKRELREETGYTSEKFIYLGKVYTDPTNINFPSHLYAALDCVKSENIKLDPGEQLQTELISKAKIRQMIKNNIITDSQTLACFLLGIKYLK